MATQGNKKLAAQRRAELAAKQAAMARAEKRRKIMFGSAAGELVRLDVSGGPAAQHDVAASIASRL